MRLIVIFFFLISSEYLPAQNVYFPPLNNTAPWDTTSPSSLNWCNSRIDSLYNFLGRENTKAFILLKNGKIVLEKYYGTFSQDSIWYWASAGKTITSFLVGKAQEEGYLSINDTTSKYLGQGWTSCTNVQEAKITIRNQLTMTSGLDDGVPDDDCIIDTCLKYLADAGTRWSYHNAPYTLLHGVIEDATNTTVNNYTQTKVKNRIGMTGTWLPSGSNVVYYSKARSMARFGLMISNNSIWGTDTIMIDPIYKSQMINTSQQINKSYGYLWWLNGKSSYMLPTLQNIFPGSYAPEAPSDMYSALGKNGQILSISESQGIVFVRMGESPNAGQASIATLFCNQIWKRINELNCSIFPLNISAFEATKENQKIMLRWTTENEINVSHFNIERSEDGTNFLNIGSVKSNRQGSKTYHFEDALKMYSGNKLFYRIQQLDKNGATYYSPVVPISNNNKIKVTLQPNPANNYISINGRDLNRIVIVNTSGKVLIKKDLLKGNNNHLLDISALPNGIYTVILTKANSNTEIQKLVVQ